MEKEFNEYVTFNVTAKDGQYIYECIIAGDDFKVEQIKKEFDYNRIVNAYMHMEE